jgi:PhzF family phenazine biosynthesis protein
MPSSDDVLHIAAFSDGNLGGNPAGVLIADTLPTDETMQQIASDIGYSETAFAAPIAGGWRVRYFSPASEVPFCGHATIALGAALARDHGDGVFALTLNDARITVEGRREGELYSAALQSPPTRSSPAPGPLVEAVLQIFDYGKVDLHKKLPPGRAHAGADHLVIGLASHEALVAMHYGLAACRLLMNAAGLVTIVLAWPENSQRFHTRNPFASAGIYEDPATGAGTAALAGYLRDLGWPHGGQIEVIQGEDMGQRSRLWADIAPEKGSSIRVSGLARFMA